MGLQKIFVLGVGAQKSGTTWLHSYLRRFADVNFGPIKEYHVWDAISSPVFSKFIVDEAALSNAVGTPAIERVRIRYAMQNNPGFYEAFFSGLIRGEVRITGDITPAYAGLDVQTLSAIRQRMEDAGFIVKVVFLMRDPVERIWSAARMQHRHEVSSARRRSTSFDDVDRIRRLYRNDRTVAISRYDRTIVNIEQIFGQPDIFYALYENLFTIDTVRNLGTFLGIGFETGHFVTRVNASPKAGELSEEFAQEVAEFYEPVYTFCEAHFPETRLLWNRGRSTTDNSPHRQVRGMPDDQPLRA
ncbi:hypothetical protein J3E64_002650 [Sphingobium sp. OAS761]|uniref:sulfotransferase n=1 Tax=Sphingobium sp. OAS761 TaxID=2817901 RepID=UPI00209D7FC8|nr:sulfotransferase [Sphingobium sp. OAS761]MCP1470953.1 hypothetical protein [Sphingobium sp. OAS761]